MSALLETVGEQPVPQVLWSMQYHQRTSTSSQIQVGNTGGVIVLPSLSQDLALDDNVLEYVQRAWQRITGEDQETFLKLEAREGMEDDDSFT